MKFSWIIGALIIGCCFRDLHGLDYRGTHFVLTFIENRILVEEPVMHVYLLSHSPRDVSYTVSAPGMRELLGQGTLPPAATRRLVLRDRQLIDTDSDTETYRGIEIESSGDITVQAANVNELSTDSFLVIPVKSWGTDYFVMSYIYTGIKQHGYTQGPSEFGIVSASMERVNVTFTFPRPGMMQHLMTSRHSFSAMDTSFWIMLSEKGSTYLLQSAVDLSGVRVTASLPVGVIAGTTWTSVGTEYMGDHLVEMMPPTNAWGGHFFTQPLANRSAGDVFRLLAKSNDTFVRIQHSTTDTPTVVELQTGEYYDFEESAPTHIISNKGVLLAQFCKSYAADSNRESDPFFVLLPPVEQFAFDFEFSTLKSLHVNFTQHYLNLIMPTNAVENLLLDDKPVPEQKLYRKWQVLDRTDYSAATLIIQNGHHRVTTSGANIPMGGISYGFKLQESYGMVVNHNLNRIRYVCTTTAMLFADFFDNDCDGYIDEEIANGMDDDGDGLIDEDVYNNSSSRYEYKATAPRTEVGFTSTQLSGIHSTTTEASTLDSKTTVDIKTTTVPEPTTDWTSIESTTQQQTVETTVTTIKQDTPPTTFGMSTDHTVAQSTVPPDSTSTLPPLTTTYLVTTSTQEKITTTKESTTEASTFHSSLPTTTEDTTVLTSTEATILSTVYSTSTSSVPDTTTTEIKTSPNPSTHGERETTTVKYTTQTSAATTSVTTARTTEGTTERTTSVSTSRATSPFTISEVSSPSLSTQSSLPSTTPVPSTTAESIPSTESTTTSAYTSTATTPLETTFSSEVPTPTTQSMTSPKESIVYASSSQSTAFASTEPPSTTSNVASSTLTHTTPATSPLVSTAKTTEQPTTPPAEHTTTSTHTAAPTTTFSSVVTGTEGSRSTTQNARVTQTTDYYTTDGNSTLAEVWNETTRHVAPSSTTVSTLAKKTRSTWDKYKAAILIPVLIVTGFPLLCLLFLLAKAIFGSKVKKKKPIPPKPKPMKKYRAAVTPTFDARAQMATDYGNIGWAKLDKLQRQPKQPR